MKILSGLFLVLGNFSLFLGALGVGLRQNPLAPDWPWLVFCLYPGLVFLYYTSGSFADSVDGAIRYHTLVSVVSSLVLVFTGLMALLGLMTFWIPAVAMGYLVLSFLEYLASCFYFQESQTGRTVSKV